MKARGESETNTATHQFVMYVLFEMSYAPFSVMPHQARTQPLSKGAYIVVLSAFFCLQ